MKHNEIKHVAVVMDGNGRWAKQRLRPRVWGHIRGSYIVSDIVQAASDYGLASLTLYAFSTENWKRSTDEVQILFSLLKKFILKEREKILANNISFKVIGDISSLPKETICLILDLENETKSNTGLKLSFAFSYGGRAEIVKACNTFIKNNKDELITEEALQKYLYRSEIPDIDLVIRTGGEQRISNFLLWQIAYSEFYFTPTKWPEFTPLEFIQIIENVKKRERRFGAVNQSSYYHHQKYLEPSQLFNSNV
jgi:undecaprenyl diphosphate synthase